MKYRAGMALSCVVALLGCGTQASLPTSPAFAARLVTNHSHSRTEVSASASAFAQGEADLRAHQYAAAVQEFKKSIQLHQNTVQSYAGLGTAYFGMRQFSNSYNAFRTASDLQQTNADYAYKASLAALYASKNKASIAYATRFIHLQPRTFNGYHLRFVAYNNALLRKQLLPDASMEVKLEPRNASAHDDLGIAYSQNGKYAAGIAEYTRAIALQRTNYAFYVNRAVAENLNKQQAAAMHDLQLAYKYAPTAKARQNISLAMKSLAKAMKQHR